MPHTTVILIGAIALLAFLFVVVRSLFDGSELATDMPSQGKRYHIGWVNGMGEVVEGFSDMGMFPDDLSSPTSHFFHVTYKGGAWESLYMPSFIVYKPLDWISELAIVIGVHDSRERAREHCERSVGALTEITDRHRLWMSFIETGRMPDRDRQMQMVDEIKQQVVRVS